MFVRCIYPFDSHVPNLFPDFQKYFTKRSWRLKEGRKLNENFSLTLKQEDIKSLKITGRFKVFAAIFSVELPMEKLCNCLTCPRGKGRRWQRQFVLPRGLTILLSFNVVLFSYYNYLSVNDIWDYLRLCCNPFHL